MKELRGKLLSLPSHYGPKTSFRIGPIRQILGKSIQFLINAGTEMFIFPK